MFDLLVDCLFCWVCCCVCWVDYYVNGLCVVGVVLDQVVVWFVVLFVVVVDVIVGFLKVEVRVVVGVFEICCE